MFIPSKLYHSACQFTCDVSVPDSFGVLCWNVHKNNTRQSRFKSYLKTIETQFDFMLLQEANFRNDEHFALPHFAYDAAANLEIRKSFYGVLTASRVKSTKAEAYLSQRKESLIGPHKSLLVTRYSFEDKNPLFILNVHAINFRENKGFNKELERFLVLLESQKGAMIVAGDFNTWNKQRLLKLHEMREILGLKAVKNEGTQVKSFMGNPLDFIFYRGLELEKSSVDHGHGLSDHNPLFAQFKKSNEDEEQEQS